MASGRENGAGDWAGAIPRDRAVLVTGAAGFVGYHLADALLAAGIPVGGVDDLNDYYDPALKAARLERLRRREGFAFERVDIADRGALHEVFARQRPRIVVNLAAQAGVRHSLENPHAYGASNLTGFLNVLEECRHGGVEHLVYASSSSVYGGNEKAPFSTSDPVDHPVSLYAATKKAGELMAHSYAHLYGLPATGLRFFTVYGPWGRPDMAYYMFTKAIFEGAPVRIFNRGEMWRDFTYVDDVVEGVARVIPRAPAPDPGFDRRDPDPAASWAPHRIYNIGNTRREKLMDMVSTLEQLIGREAIKEFRDMPPGDVLSTWADVSGLEEAVGFRPSMPLREGLERFVAWYRGYHRPE